MSRVSSLSIKLTLTAHHTSQTILKTSFDVQIANIYKYEKMLILKSFEGFSIGQK